MTDRIKTAFDGIRAEDRLVADTLAYLRIRLREQNKQKSFVAAKRAAVAFVSLCVLFLCAFSYNAYFTESMFVDIDVNPSIALSVNRFDRVIGMHAYNDDAIALLDAVRIKHRNYEDAVGVLIDVMMQNGYTKDEWFVSITLKNRKEDNVNLLLADLESVVRERYVSAEVETFTVDASTRNTARDLDLSPARYLAILGLQEVDPTASVESCRNQSIRELRRLTEEHTASHNHQGTDNDGHAIRNEHDNGYGGDDVSEQGDDGNSSPSGNTGLNGVDGGYNVNNSGDGHGSGDSGHGNAGHERDHRGGHE